LTRSEPRSSSFPLPPLLYPPDSNLISFARSHVLGCELTVCVFYFPGTGSRVPRDAGWVWTASWFRVVIRLNLLSHGDFRNWGLVLAKQGMNLRCVHRIAGCCQRIKLGFNFAIYLLVNPVYNYQFSSWQRIWALWVGHVLLSEPDFAALQPC
jgi:hypothetical protein